MTALQTLVEHYATPLPRGTTGRYYFASPYTAKDSEKTAAWVEEIKALVPQIIKAYPGIVPIVPVTITDPLAADDCEPAGGWYAFGLTLEDGAEGMIIVTQEGWEHSRGIMLELGFARGKGIPIYTLNPQNVTNTASKDLVSKNFSEGFQQGQDDSEAAHGLAESDILAQMERLRQMGEGYENWTQEALRAKAIDILDDIPF